MGPGKFSLKGGGLAEKGGGFRKRGAGHPTGTMEGHLYNAQQRRMHNCYESERCGSEGHLYNAQQRITAKNPRDVGAKDIYNIQQR